MKKNLELVILLAIALTCLAFPSVALGQVYPIETDIGRGTAVAVGHLRDSQDRQVTVCATVKHVVEDRGRRAGRLHLQCGTQVFPARRISLHPTKDLATFVVYDRLPSVKLLTGPLPESFPVEFCGFGKVFNQTGEDLCVTGFVENGGDLYFRDSRSVIPAPGDSGGPVFATLPTPDGSRRGVVAINTGFDLSTRTGRVAYISSNTIRDHIETQFPRCSDGFCYPVVPRPVVRQPMVGIPTGPPQIIEQWQPDWNNPQPLQKPSVPVTSGVPVASIEGAVADYLRRNPPPAGPPGPRGEPGQQGPVGERGDKISASELEPFLERMIELRMPAVRKRIADQVSDELPLIVGEVLDPNEIAGLIVSQYGDRLRGPPGEPGKNGTDGKNGTNGAAGVSPSPDEIRQLIKAEIASRPEEFRGPAGAQGLVGVPDSGDIERWLIGAMSDPDARKSLASMFTDVVSNDPRVTDLVRKIDDLENSKQLPLRVLIVDGANDRVLDDETFEPGEPIILDVRALVKGK